VSERLVILDIEATCWGAEEHPALASDQRNESETIEIGAVRPDAPGETFRTLIRPRRHPELSDYCTRLTGITQQDIEGAPLFPEALAAFLDWAGSDRDLAIASWGAWDDRLLRRDAGRWGLPAPRWRAVNAKRQFARWAKQQGLPRGGWMALRGAIAHLGGQFQGTPHRGLDDARNLAWVLEQIRG
jgi:inhibitor of KinA sporulation pathway (predicted exonuclease)